MWREQANQARALNHNQKANGNARETITNYFVSKDLQFRYPPALRKLLHEAVFTVTREAGIIQVSSILLFDVFRRLVNQFDLEHENESVVPLTPDGKPTYYREELYRFVRLYMGKFDETDAMVWEIKRFQSYNEDMADQKKSAARLKFESMGVEDFAQYIVDLVHDNRYAIDETKMEREVDFTSAQGHELKVQYSSISEAYDEWHGLGEFANVPIAGGIQACEDHFKNKRCAHMKGVRFGDQKEVLVTLHTALNDSDDPHAVMSDWNEMFQGTSTKKVKAKAQFQNMKKVLKQRGIIKLGAPRGRHVSG